jgi:hypothetical protein
VTEKLLSFFCCPAPRDWGIISAQDGEGVDPAVVQAVSARAEHEGKRISQTTKEARRVHISCSVELLAVYV